MPPRHTHPAWWSWAVREHELTAETILVLLTLCEHGDDEWLCEQSERNIAQNVGLARMTVRKALARLVEIQAIVELGRRNVRTPQRYRVSPSRPPTAAQIRMLATTASRRAVIGPDGGWLVAAE